MWLVVVEVELEGTSTTKTISSSSAGDKTKSKTKTEITMEQNARVFYSIEERDRFLADLLLQLATTTTNKNDYDDTNHNDNDDTNNDNDNRKKIKGYTVRRIGITAAVAADEDAKCTNTKINNNLGNCREPSSKKCLFFTMYFASCVPFDF